MKKYILMISVLAAASAFGEIKMPKIFSDGMVLQRDMPVKIWGIADANASVDVEFAGAKKSAKAGSDGKWSVVLDKMPASKTPRELGVSENGKPGKKISDVLVGEVWIAGGQSNMEWRLRATTDADAAKARAHYPTMRYFNQPAKASLTPRADSFEESNWSAADGENISAWSGVGFYFAERIMKELDVPVAILYASKGATSMTCWIPEESHAKVPYLAGYLANFKKSLAKFTPEIAQKRLDAHNAKCAKARAEDAKLRKEGKPVQRRKWPFWVAPSMITPWADYSTPYMLYNGMVAPIAGYTARGVIWYQGEGDTTEKASACFAEQYKTLVESWRKAFGNDNMAFLQVQLASYENKAKWPEARAGQLAACKLAPNVGAVCIIDCGEEKDIHPKDKTTVGNRLALLALSDVYKKAGFHGRSPEFVSAQYKGDTVKIKFKDFGRGLVFKGEPRGFEVLTKGKWEKAAAKLDGGKIVLKSSDGSMPEGARYLWTQWARPDASLFNKDGLPAFPFQNVR